MDHLEIWEAADTTPSAWEVWCTEVERILGGEELDGPELAAAHDAWKFGVTPTTFAHRLTFGTEGGA
jgi:hypothetical protein